MVSISKELFAMLVDHKHQILSWSVKMKFIKSSFCTFFLAMYSLPVSQSVEFVVLGDLL